MAELPGDPKTWPDANQAALAQHCIGIDRRLRAKRIDLSPVGVATVAEVTYRLLHRQQQEKIELLARVLEYEHAMQHVINEHAGVTGATCPDCQALCQSALDGLNREDFREMAAERIEDSEMAAARGGG